MAARDPTEVVTVQHLCPRGALTAKVPAVQSERSPGQSLHFPSENGSDSVLTPKSAYAKMVTIWRHNSLPRWRRGTSGTRFPNQGSPRGQAEETALGVELNAARAVAAARRRGRGRGGVAVAASALIRSAKRWHLWGSKSYFLAPQSHTATPRHLSPSPLNLSVYGAR